MYHFINFMFCMSARKSIRFSKATFHDRANPPHNTQYQPTPRKEKILLSGIPWHSTAFDKVWHEGLLYKLKKILSHTYYSILKSYLTKRQFMVKYLDATTFPIEAGIPQGSVLGSLFSIYTAGLPIWTEIIIATFADDTALLASHVDPIIASSTLQRSLDSMEKWFYKWGFKINENKSIHVTFTLRKQTCPQVTINNTTIPQSDTWEWLWTGD